MTVDPEPYLRLVGAVLQQAVRDHHRAIKAHGPTAAQSMEPALWLHSDASWPFSARWCCDLLELDILDLRHRMSRPDAVRRFAKLHRASPSRPTERRPKKSRAAVRHGPKMQQCMDWLIRELEAGPQQVTAVRRAAQEAGHAWSKVKRARVALGIESETRTNRRGCEVVWRIP